MAESAEAKIIVSAVDKASASIKTITQNFADAGKRMQSIGKSMSATLTLPLTAIGAFSLKASNEFESLSLSFDRMTSSMGVDGQELLKELDKMAAGTISTNNLMLSANKAMSLGVAKNMEDFTQLMELARLKGRDMGLTTTQAFNDIVTGIGRGSPLILDNLGITVKLGEAYAEYAEELGKTTEELSAAEKQQALLNAVLESGAEDIENAGELTTTNKEKMEAFGAAIADAGVAIGGILSEHLTPLIEKLTELIGKFEELDPKTQKLIVAIGLIAAGLGPALIALGALVTIMGVLTGPIGLVVLAVTALIAIGVALALQWKQVKQDLMFIFESMGERIGIILRQIGDTITLIWRGVRDFLMSVLTGIADFFVGVWKGILEFLTGILDSIRMGIEAAFNAISSFIHGVLNTISGVWTSVWGAVKSTTDFIWNGIKNGVTSGIQAVHDVIKSFMDPIKNLFSGMWDGISGIFTKGTDAVKGITEGGMRAVIKVINAVISGLNAAIRTANLLPGIKMQQIPTIPQLAEGGIVTRPTLAMIGEGGEHEAVVPLSRANEFGFGGAGGGMTIVNNFLGTVSSKEVAEEYADLMVARLALSTKLV